MAMTNEQISFINDLAERLEGVESANEALGGLSEKLDGIGDLAKNFDFGGEIAEIKQVLSQVVGFLGLDMGEQGAAAVTAEGGMEKGDAVVTLGEHSDARKKEGKNFAADLMPIPTLSKRADGAEQVTLLGTLVGISKRLEALEGQAGGRTSGEVTGEPVQKRAEAAPLFAGKFGAMGR